MNNIFKRTVAFILTLSITMSVLPLSVFANDTEEVYTLTSEYIKVEVSSENGGFHIDTVMGDKLEKDDDNKMLLHNSSDYDTSFTSFRISVDGKEKDYIFGRNYGFLGLSGTDLHTEIIGDSIISTWTVEDIEITQRIELANNSSSEHGMVIINYTAKNTGTKKVDSIKARIMLDTALGYQDYAYYKIPEDGKYITVENERIIDGNTVGSMMFGYDDEFMPSITAYTVNSAVEGTECIPEKVAFGHWNNLASTIYDFTPNADLTFTNQYNAQYLTADSAYALYYDMGSLEAGAHSSIATNYGVYSNADVADGTKLAINISGASPMVLNADKSAYISSNVQDAEGELTLTANIKNFTDTAVENVRIVVYPDDLMTPIDENGSTESPSGETYSSENPYSVTYSSIGADQTNIVDFRFKAHINKTASYREIELVAYKIDEDSDFLLQDNIIGRQNVYILCPGTDDGIPDVVLTGCTEYMYYTGKQRLSVTGIGLNMLTDPGTYNFKLKQITGENTYGAVISIDSQYAVINFEDNTVDITIPEFFDEQTGIKKWPTGTYQLVIDYVDSEKIDVASTPARVIVTDDPKYANLNFGIVVVEQTGFPNPDIADCTYQVKTFKDEEMYKEYLKIYPDAEILVELKGDFSDERVDEDGSVYHEATVIDSNSNTKNPVTLNNSMELRSGYIKVITQNKGQSDQTILVDINGNMRVLGTGTLVHDGTAVLTEIKNGFDYDLRRYTDEGIRCSELPEHDPRRQQLANKQLITYVFAKEFDQFVSIMNIVNADLTFGELGVMVDRNGKEVTKLVSFAARIDLGLLVPKGSKEFKASFDSAWKDYQKKSWDVADDWALAVGTFKRYDGTTLRETYKGFMDTKYAQQYAARKSKGLIEATAEVEDILFGGGSCIGCNFSVNIGLPPLTSTMPGISGTLTVGTIAAWRFDVEGYAEFTGLTVEAKLGVVYSDKIAGPMVDDLYLYVEFPPTGFNIDGFGVVWLRGGGGGINNLYELVYTPATLPSTSIVMSVAASVIQVILLKINLEVGLTGVSLVAERGTLSETGILVLRNSGVRFQWYPSFKFSGNVNMDFLGIINGSGYIVVDPAASSYEFFAMVSLMVPLAFPLIGGMTVGSVGIGVNEEKIWGKVTIIGLSFGILYYWGGNFSFIAGENKGLEPSYPELMSESDIPVAYDEETGKTLYAHIVPTFSLAKTASVTNDTAFLAADNSTEIVLLSNADKTHHLLNLGVYNGNNGALNIKYTASSKEEAIQLANQVAIKNNETDASYPLVLLNDDESNADTANTYVVYNEDTAEAKLVVSFTDWNNFYTNWDITTAAPSVLEIYNVANLPEFVLDNADLNDSKVNVEWNVIVGENDHAYDRVEKISVYAITDKEHPEESGTLLGTIIDENVLKEGKTSFDIPADLPSGEYYIKAVATMDETLIDTVITDTAFAFTNSFQPKAVETAVLTNAGDYRVKVSVTEPDEPCDAYQVNLYEVSTNEQNQFVYTELQNVSGTIFAAGDELIVGGRYEYKPEEGEESSEPSYIGLEAGKTYATGVRRIKYLLDADGNQTGMVTSEETFSEGIVLTLPTPPEISAAVMSANGESAIELSVGTAGDIEMKLPTVTSADAKIKLTSNMPISGKWYLNNISYEAAEENELYGTFGSFENSSEIIIDLKGLETQEHSLRIDGVNANGDGFTKTVKFVVDTYTPMLALNSPLTGSTATASDEIIIDGRTEADAKLKVEVNGVLIGEKAPEEWDENSEDGSFAFTVPADESVLKNKLTLTATDRAGNVTKENITVINKRYTDISGVRIYLDGEDVTGKQLNTKEGIAGKLDLMGITNSGDVFVINDEALIEWNSFIATGSIKVYENGEEISLMSDDSTPALERTILVGENSNGMLSGMLRLTSDSGLSAATGFGLNGSHQITYDNSDRVIISVTPKTADAGDTVTVSAVVREGYMFAGWTSNSADVIFADPSALTTTFVMPDNDVHIMTTVPGTVYTVTLNTNGGTINSGNVTNYEHGTGTALPVDVTRSGYVFGGWYEREDFTDSAVTEIAASDSGNKEYFAKWIKKQEVVIDDAVQTYQYNPDGNAFEIKNTALTGFSIEYFVNDAWTKTAPTEIGSYTVRITRAEDADYDSFSKTLENSLVIVPEKVTKPISDTTIFIYDGTEKVYGIESTDDYNVTGNTRTDAGNQTVTVALKDSVHFTWDDDSTENLAFTFKVNPIVVEISWSEASFVYDRHEKSVTPTITNKVAGDEVNLTVDGTTSATDKGNYTAIVTAVDNPNYTIDGSENLEKIWAISEATNEWTAALAITGWTYGETANVPTATAKFDAPVFTYSDSIDGTYTESVPTEAGTYYVKATVAGTGNYAELNSEPKEFVISKRPVNISWENTENLVYDNTAKTVSAVIANKLAGDVISLTFDGTTTATDAGTYTARVTGVSNNNYTVDAGTNLEKTWTIAKGTNAWTTPLTVADRVYGDAINEPVAVSKYGAPTFEYSDEENGTYMGTVPTNAGTWYVKATVEGNDNYETIESEPVSFTISQRAVNITWQNTDNLVYDNSAKTVSAVLANKVDGDSAELTVSGTLTATNAGVYTAIVTGINNSNYTLTNGVNLEKTWAIAVTTNDWISPLSIEGWTYGDTANAPMATAIFGDALYTYSDREDGAFTEAIPETVGTWYVKATVEGTINYAEISDIKEFVIAEKTLDANAVTAIEDVTFTGEELKPVIEIKHGEKVLVLGTDYEVAYTDNTNAGTAKVIISFKGNYAGSVEKEFIILPKTINTDLVLAAPVKNIAPQTSIETDEYTATVSWSPEVTNKFAQNTEYTATITIVPKTNYTVSGVAENEYTVSGAKTISNAADSNIVIVTYEKTSGRTIINTISSTRYTVTFYTDGGSTIASKTVIRNGKVAEPTAPTKDGYSFVGWFTDEELTTAYDFDDAVTKSFTLYAKWAKHDDDSENPDTPDTECNGTEADNCASLGFEDLDVEAWYHLDTDYAIENGIFKGTSETTFEPDANITRAMMITVLYRVEGEPAVNKSIPFEDVDVSSYYANAVVWAKQNGIVNGVSETEFAPDDNITREQIAAIMHRYAQYKGIDVSIGENTNILSYDDFADISEYAIASMQWTVGSGLIKGKFESTLCPLDNATRAEIAAILHRFIEANK